MTYHGYSPYRERGIVLEETDAKQGLELHELHYVLGFGLSGAILGLALVIFFLAY